MKTDLAYQNASCKDRRSLPAYHISPWLAAAVPNIFNAPEAVMNTGTSINFDANALQSQDEAEFQKEEQQQLEELRELLSNALDNLTEDGLSVSSNDEDEEGELSREGSFKSGKKQRVSGNTSFDHHPVLSNTFPGGVTNKLIQNGTIQTNKALCSTMPGSSASNNDDTGQPYNPQQDLQQQQQPMYYPQYHYLYPADENSTSDGHTVANYDSHSHAIYPAMSGNAHAGHHYGVVQGGVLHETGHNRAENDQWISPGSGGGYYQENFRQDHLPAGAGGDYYSQIPTSVSYDTQSFVPGHMQPYQSNGADVNSHSHQHRSPPNENCSVPTSVGMEISHQQTNGYTLPIESEHPVTSNWDQLNGYKVQYRKTTEPVMSPQKKERTHSVSSSSESSPKKSEKDFIRIGGSSEQKGLAQLQILYKARGRKLDELTEELTSVKQDSAREIRLLQHKVSSTESECEAVTNNLKQCQEMLREAKSDNTQLLSRMETSEALIQALSNSKEELVSKLVAAEAAVESLNHQLKELGKSETLERARQQHDNVVESLQLRHQREVVMLKEEIDTLTKTANSSKEEMALLKRQLSDALKNVDNAHISKAETINRLTRSLEESQRQNQYLLQNPQSSLSSQQIAELQNRLQQAESSKITLEEKCENLGDQVKSLSQQLSMFESASKLGIFGQEENRHSSCDPEDSFLELGIKKKLNFTTPDTTVSEDSGVDTQLQGLKHELQRCLTNNREKQICIEQLKDSLKVCQKEASSWQSECAKTETVVQELKKKLAKSEQVENGLGTGQKGTTAQKSIETLEEEASRLKKDKEGFAETLRLSKEKEMQLESRNKELKEEFKKVLEEHAADKANALEHCKKTYETFQDDVKERLKLDLQLEHDAREASLIADYEEKINGLKTKLEATLQREDNLKEMYVCVCQEKSQLEDNLIQDYRKKLEVEIGRLKSEYKRDIAEMKDVEIQCESSEDDNEITEANIHGDMFERLLAKARDEVAMERAQELVALRQETVESFEVRKSRGLLEDAGKVQRDVEPEAKENLDQEVIVFNEEDQLNQIAKETLHERIKGELRAQFETEKQEEWKLRECELKKNYLEEIEQLQAELTQKSSEVQVTGLGMPLSPQSLEGRRLDEKQRVKAAVDAAKVEWQLLHKAKLEMEVKRRLNLEREQWQKEKTLSAEKDVEKQLSTEKLKWQKLAKEEQKNVVAAAVETAREEWQKSRQEEHKKMSMTLAVERAEMKKQQKELLQQLMCQLQSQYWMCIQAVKNDVTKYMSESNIRLCHLVCGTSIRPALNAGVQSPFQPAGKNGWKEQTMNLREIQSNIKTKVAKKDVEDIGSFVELSECTDSCTSSELQ